MSSPWSWFSLTLREAISEDDKGYSVDKSNSCLQKQIQCEDRRINKHKGKQTKRMN